MNVEKPEEKLYRLILQDLAEQSRILRNFESAVVPAIQRLDSGFRDLRSEVTVLNTDVAVLKSDVAEVKASVVRIEALLTDRG